METQTRPAKLFYSLSPQGFCVDLLEHIAELVGFNYVIELVPDNNYGALNLTTGNWNGLVRGTS